jgi:hypothetical protein
MRAGSCWPSPCTKKGRWPSCGACNTPGGSPRLRNVSVPRWWRPRLTVTLVSVLVMAQLHRARQVQLLWQARSACWPVLRPRACGALRSRGRPRPSRGAQRSEASGKTVTARGTVHWFTIEKTGEPRRSGVIDAPGLLSEEPAGGRRRTPRSSVTARALAVFGLPLRSGAAHEPGPGSRRGASP